MSRYLLRTTCRSYPGKDRDVAAVSAFCGPGTEQVLRSHQAAPGPDGSRQCSHPQNHRSVIPQSMPKFWLGSASTLLSWVSLAFVQSKRNPRPRKTIMELKKEH